MRGFLFSIERRLCCFDCSKNSFSDFSFMSLSVEYVSFRLFVDGYYGRLHSNHYFRCHNDKCPFSVLLNVELVAGEARASSTKKVVCPVHFHEVTERCKGQVKRELMEQLKFIQEHPGHPLALQYQQQHALWNRSARKDSKRFLNSPIDKEALMVYAHRHTEKKGRNCRLRPVSPCRRETSKTSFVGIKFKRG